MADVSITPEEFNEKYVPLLNAAADLIISHPEIPEDIEQSDILTRTERHEDRNGKYAGTSCRGGQQSGRSARQKRQAD